MTENQPEQKHIIRVLNTDLEGKKAVLQALRKIKGISFMFSNFVCAAAQIEKTKKAGLLSDAEVKRLESVLKSPVDHKAPTWMLNRRFDPEEGTDKHIIGSDLTYTHESDIKLLRKLKSYKGIRHGFGLPVRGQRTKSNFRKNKGKVQGVTKKATAPKKAAPAAKK